MKKLAIAMAGLAGLAASPAYAALTVSQSNFSGVAPAGTFASSSVFCTGGGTPCTFTETVTFTSSVPLNLVSATISTIAVGGIGSSSDINFTSVTLNGTAFTLGSAIGGVFEFGSLDRLSFLAPGTHTLTVQGITYGSDVGLDGSYSGTLNFAQNVVQSGVPEPTTWLSMMLGFGALGLAMRRKGQPVRRVNFNMA
jgi:hypothetical protein